jgi:hypothetical protein
MLQHPSVGLGQQRNIQRTALLGCAIETDLVGEDGFTGARGAMDDIDAAFQETSRQNLIQCVDPSRQEIKLH